MKPHKRNGRAARDRRRASAAERAQKQTPEQRLLVKVFEKADAMPTEVSR